MEQVQNDTDRFAGRFMIQDNDHMAAIPQVQDEQGQQSEQSQSNGGQQGGERRSNKKSFAYRNPRQY